MKNSQEIQESYWPRLASQPLQFFLRIHQGQGLSALHLKRGSTPPSRWSLKAKQQAVWNVGTIAPALYNLSRKRHVIIDSDVLLQSCSIIDPPKQSPIERCVYGSTPVGDTFRIHPAVDRYWSKTLPACWTRKKTGSVLLSVIPDQILVHIYNKKFYLQV